MNSPFPGMDPYLEQNWRDVHASLVLYARDQLQPELPRDLLARVEERVYVETDEERRRSMYPDVRIVQHGRGASATAQASGAIALAQPYVLQIEEEPVTETFIEIREAGTGNRIVTVIEFPSPTNKIPGDGRDIYRRKQQELRQAQASLVEVDLVRSGDPVFVYRHLHSPYRVTVRRGWQPLKLEFYPISLRERLPAIRVPLRQGDQDVPLNLQPIVDQAYQNGRYDLVDYATDPDPPLSAEDQSWVDALLRAASKRQ
jgi:hypothetical protein